MIVIGQKSKNSFIVNLIFAVICIAAVVIFWNNDFYYKIFLIPAIIFFCIRLFLYLKTPTILIYIENEELKIFNGKKYESIKMSEIKDIIVEHSILTFKQLEHGSILIKTDNKSINADYVANIEEVKTKLLIIKQKYY